MVSKILSYTQTNRHHVTFIKTCLATKSNYQIRESLLIVNNRVKMYIVNGKILNDFVFCVILRVIYIKYLINIIQNCCSSNFRQNLAKNIKKGIH